MDTFLMVEKMTEEVERYNYWVGNNVFYDHLLILMQLEKGIENLQYLLNLIMIGWLRNILDFLLQKMEIYEPY